MLSKEVFDKVTFNRVNICANKNETVMKQIKTAKNPEENPYQPMDF
jgi:hypothetical protein